MTFGASSTARRPRWSSLRAVPFAYLLPAGLLALLFLVWPMLFTLALSFTNYGGRHVESKAAAIALTVTESVLADENSPRYPLRAAVAEGASPQTGQLVLIYVDTLGSVAVADITGGHSIPSADVTKDLLGTLLSVKGYQLLTPDEATVRQSQIIGTTYLTAPDRGIRALTTSEAALAKATLTYDAGKDRVIDTSTGRVFIPKDGALTSVDGVTLPIGWLETVGMNNFVKFLTNAEMRSAVVGVAVWTVVFAGVSVVVSFLLGFLAALVLDDPRMRWRRTYRALIVLPYAVPAVVSALTWRGMFATQGGFVNQILGVVGMQPDWLGTPNTARLVTLAANIWFGFPLMFLVATAAIRTVPVGIRETARLDGAGRLTTLRSVILPVLATSVGPALIAAFAFNLNNFPLIQVLTGGAPFNGINDAGATDLLITYAYRSAFGPDSTGYGPAAAVSVLALVLTGLSVIWVHRGGRTIREIRSRPTPVIVAPRDPVDFDHGVETPAPGTPLLLAEHESIAGQGSLWWRHAFAVVAAAWSVLPLLVLLRAAFAPSSALDAGPGLSLANFADLSTDAHPYWTWYAHTIVLAVAGAALSVGAAAAAAFALTRVRYAGRRLGLAILLFLQLAPPSLAMIGLYVTMENIGGLVPAVGSGSLLGILLVYVGISVAWATWLLRGYVGAVPRELDEAATIDGAQRSGVFLMILRLVRPVALTVFALVLVSLWGELLFGGLLLPGSGDQTLAVGLWRMSVDQDWSSRYGVIAAGGLLATLPMVALHVALQGRLVRVSTLRPGR